MRLPLLLQLQPSRRLAMLFVALHAAASGGVFILGWNIWATLGLLALLLVSLAFTLRRHYGRHPAWVRLGQKGELAWGQGEKESPRLRLLPGTCWRHLVVLRYRLEQEDGTWSRPHAVCLLADSLADEASFRQLRVWLGWRAKFRDDGIF